jgi:hypothetical protein
MAAGDKLTSQRDRRERVPRVPEGGQEQPPPRRRRYAQSISAMSRTICLRLSASGATVETMRVPTPASR